MQAALQIHANHEKTISLYRYRKKYLVRKKFRSILLLAYLEVAMLINYFSSNLEFDPTASLSFSFDV